MDLKASSQRTEDLLSSAKAVPACCQKLGLRVKGSALRDVGVRQSYACSAGRTRSLNCTCLGG